MNRFTFLALLAVVAAICWQVPAVVGQAGKKPVDRETVTGGKVVGVHDGDTVTVYRGSGPQVKVRLDGIDAPELGQPFGKVSRDALAGLVFGKEVTLHGHGQDRYGRTLAGVSVGKVNVCLSMVRSGMAWHFKRYSKDAGLAAAENAARAAKVGLWADPAPVPPWTWRAEKSVRVKK